MEHKPDLSFGEIVLLVIAGVIVFVAFITWLASLGAKAVEDGEKYLDHEDW